MHGAHRSQPEFDFDDEQPAARNKPAAIDDIAPAVAAAPAAVTRRPAFEPRPPLAHIDDVDVIELAVAPTPTTPRHDASTPADDAANTIAEVERIESPLEPVAVIEDSIVAPEPVPAPGRVVDVVADATPVVVDDVVVDATPVVVDDVVVDATPVEVAPLVVDDTVVADGPVTAAIVEPVEPATRTRADESVDVVVPHTASLFDPVPQNPEPESTEPTADDDLDDDGEHRA